jgi:hypothetical protein
MQISLLWTTNSVIHHSHGIYATRDGHPANQEIPALNAYHFFCGTFPETVAITQPVLTLHFNRMLSTKIRSAFTNIYYAFIIHTMYATCPTHLKFLHLITLFSLHWEAKLRSSSVHIILSIFQPPHPHTALEQPQSTLSFQVLMAAIA